MCARCDFQRDIELVNGPLDILDHAAPQLGAGSKIGIDATRKIRGEDVKGVPFERGPIHCQTDDVALRASELIGRAGITDIHLPEFGRGWMVFASVDKYEPGLGGKAIDVLFEARVGNFIVAVRPLRSPGTSVRILRARLRSTSPQPTPAPPRTTNRGPF